MMRQRIPILSKVLPGTAQGFQAQVKAVQQGGGVPLALLDLVHLRASQINGCSFCVDYVARSLKKGGETDERLFAVAAWREAPYFSAAERAALALTEAVTRLDPSDPVPDSVWEEASRHYDEKGLGAIVYMTALTNLANRANIAIRQVAGEF